MDKPTDAPVLFAYSGQVGKITHILVERATMQGGLGPIQVYISLCGKRSSNPGYIDYGWNGELPQSICEECSNKWKERNK